MLTQIGLKPILVALCAGKTTTQQDILLRSIVLTLISQHLQLDDALRSMLHPESWSWNWEYIFYLADPGEVRGCSTNTSVTDSLIH